MESVPPGTAPIQLIIRHNLAVEGDVFGVGDTRVFTCPIVRVGSSPVCECCSGGTDLAPVHFILRHNPGNQSWSLEPTPGVSPPVLTGGSEAAPGCALRGGDEIRVGHWTFRFQRVHGRVQQARRTDLMETTAKVLVALILFSEVLLVAWLPRELRSARIWEFQIACQRATLLLDRLRWVAAHGDDSGLGADAVRLVSVELDSLARFVRSHDNRIDRGQWRQIAVDLEGLDIILTSLREGKAFGELPAVDLSAAFRSVAGFEDEPPEQR